MVAGVFLMGTINWYTNSKYHFRGPPRVADNLRITELELEEDGELEDDDNNPKVNQDVVV